ncbi:binding-protein-dependent transport systems inner membrane component [Beutenbergia cavernae DSM 12333]|uniref:Binding-protein-dependent transport systems inner membrane component n=1 Tax=Beutenbergia cavernae (strain ATCC BAA-8 / DSM 12333 / CCUG 43141 / JCM 11478 / NBRC 16432 / NCIMB 13614 / HKI 0122) TaxID=471853 RepID=C5C4A9_BEUC1|nr:carbohydrate ABC transporter permease [Beutenbergia cavernae]ACQ82033.1 binding-protein-dependent transport systems inner membrane component [Beutenbergia cavernae DSM 12333]
MTAVIARTASEQQVPAERRRPAGTGRSRRLKRVGIYAFLVLGAIPTLLPLIWLVRSALMTSGQIFISPPEWIPDPVAWDNFAGALTAVPFGRYFVNTMIIEVGVLVGTLLSCSFAAFSFARLRWRFKNVVFGLLMTGVMLPYAVTLIPTFLFWQAVGAVNTYVPLILPAFFGTAVFNIFLLRQFFLSLPYELDESAYIDGANPFQVYWRIVLPLSKPALMVVGIFTFLGVWNDYLGPLIYLNDSDMYTLAMGLASFQGTYTAQWGYLMAAATVVLLPIILLFAIAQKYFVEGIALTGLKN